MNFEEITVKVETRCDCRAWLVFGDVIKWPAQLLLLFGHPGHRALANLNDFILSRSGLQVRINGGEWSYVLKSASTNT